MSSFQTPPAGGPMPDPGSGKIRMKVMPRMKAGPYLKRAFKLLAEKYPVTLISSKKMPADDRRIMSYKIEDVNDAEEFTDESMKLAGFTAIFESL